MDKDEENEHERAKWDGARAQLGCAIYMCRRLLVVTTRIIAVVNYTVSCLGNTQWLLMVLDSDFYSVSTSFVRTLPTLREGIHFVKAKTPNHTELVANFLTSFFQEFQLCLINAY